MTYSHQDWTTVVLGKPKRPTEGPCETVKKVSACAREYSDRARKLEADINADPTDAAPELAALPTLNHDMRQLMVRARVDKKITQDQLAKLVNVQPKIIKDLETGKVLTDRAVLQRINKVLGTKLCLG